MGDRALENRIRKIKDLEAQRKALDKQIDSLKDEIRADMTARQLAERRTKNFTVRFKEIVSHSFNSRRFKKDHADLYDEYTVCGSTMRLTIS